MMFGRPAGKQTSQWLRLRAGREAKTLDFHVRSRGAFFLCKSRARASPPWWKPA